MNLSKEQKEDINHNRHIIRNKPINQISFNDIDWLLEVIDTLVNICNEQSGKSDK